MTFPHLSIDQAYIDRIVMFRYATNMHQEGSVLVVPKSAQLQEGIVDYAKDKGIDIFTDQAPPAVLPPGDYSFRFGRPSEEQ